MFASGKSNRHFMDGESQPFCLNHCLSVNEPVFRLQVQTLKSRSPKHFRLAIYIHAREAEEHIEKTVVNGADYSSLQSISTLIAYSLDEIVITVERCLKNLCGVGGAYLFVSIGVTDEFATGGFQAGLNSAAVSSILCEFDELNFRKLERKCLCSLWRCIERTVKHKNEFEVGTLKHFLKSADNVASHRLDIVFFVIQGDHNRDCGDLLAEGLGCRLARTSDVIIHKIKDVLCPGSDNQTIPQFYSAVTVGGSTAASGRRSRLSQYATAAKATAMLASAKSGTGLSARWR